MSIGLRKFKYKLILKDMMSESTLNLSYLTVKYMLEDGVDLKLMVLDLGQLLFNSLLMFCLVMDRVTM